MLTLTDEEHGTKTYGELSLKRSLMNYDQKKAGWKKTSKVVRKLGNPERKLARSSLRK